MTGRGAARVVSVGTDWTTELSTSQPRARMVSPDGSTQTPWLWRSEWVWVADTLAIPSERELVLATIAAIDKQWPATP